MWLSSVAREIKLGTLLETLSSTTNSRNVTFYVSCCRFQNYVYNVRHCFHSQCCEVYFPYH